MFRGDNNRSRRLRLDILIARKEWESVPRFAVGLSSLSSLIFRELEYFREAAFRGDAILTLMLTENNAGHYT